MTGLRRRFRGRKRGRRDAGDRRGDVPREIGRQVDEEIRHHLERRAEDLVRQGVPESEAMRRAIDEFGDLDEARRDLAVIDARIAVRRGRPGGGSSGRSTIGSALDSLLDDTRLAVRRLRSRPGSALIAAAMLAMAIGLTASMFTVVDALWLRPVPFRDAENLAHVELLSPGSGPGTSTPRRILQAWRSSGVFDGVHGALPGSKVLEGAAAPVRLGSSLVTPGTFEMLGVSPLLGRTFVEGDGRAEADPVVMLSEEVWRRSFSADPSIVGDVVEMSGTPTRVVGVMPAGFRFPNRVAEIWEPVDAAVPPVRFDEAWGGEMRLNVYARLPAGVPTSEVLQRAARVARETGEWAAERRAVALPLLELDPYSQRAIAVVSAGVALVFLVLCANSANLLLGRLSTRHREFATASALGAPRARLVRQAAAEHALLGVGACAAGIGVGVGLLAGARVWLADGLLLYMTLNPIDLDARTAAAVSLLGLTAMLLAGVLPAWLATALRPVSCLRGLVDRGGTESRSSRLMSRGLLVVEIALGVTLLVGAAVLLRSFVSLTRVELGLEADRVMVVHLSLPRHAFEDSGTNVAMVREIEAELAALPGATASALSRGVPPNPGSWWRGDVVAEGRSSSTTFDRVAHYRVDPSFFEAYGIPILQGRPLRMGENETAVVLGERLARALWPDGAAAGRSYRRGERSYRVVGVAREIRSGTNLDPRRDVPEMYSVYEPSEDNVLLSGSEISLRCSRACPGADVVRRRVHDLSPRLLVSVEAASDRYAEWLDRPRAAAALATSFAIVALLTFTGGLFSALHFAVGRRMRELGIRAALGAPAARLRRAVLLDGLSLAGAGLVLGGLAAWWLSRWLAAITYETPAPDAEVWIVVSAVVVAATLAGSWSPARRAMQADPVRLLRDT